jgi:NADPH:quinone reductase-like Zn-dependent oxidoreductase
MKAIQLVTSQPPSVLAEAEVSKPAPGKGEVLIQVHAAGVTPTELIWYPTSNTKDGQPRLRAIPGHEFSGVVAAIGEGAAGFVVGDEVYGLNDWFADGATGEYCITRPASIARKPKALTHAEAAAVPIGALTAWQGLLDRAKVQAGEHVLVHGGAGAVGVFAIQLVRLHGARVTTTASAKNAAFVSQLGAETVIDYAMTAFEDVVRDVDVVFDTVGGETLQKSWSVLKPGGRLVTIAADVEGRTDARSKEAFFIVEPNQKQLSEIGDLLDSGKLRVFVDAEVSLADAPAAYERKVHRRLGYGKVVVVITA